MTSSEPKVNIAAHDPATVTDRDGGSRLRGLYLVTEPSLLRGSGARQHIAAGFEALSAHFDMRLLELGSDGAELSDPDSAGRPGDGWAIPSEWRSRLARNSVAGALRDARKWWGNYRQCTEICSAIAAHKADFIYERTAYLSFAGLNAARATGVAHFYENNGLGYEEVRKYYSSLANGLMQWLELRALRASDHVFFVGTWGDAARLGTANWRNIENGVERAFLDRFDGPKAPPDGVIRICFIGHVMPHHRLDLLSEAFRRVKHPDCLEFHVIGRCPEGALDDIRASVRVVSHGVLDRDNLGRILEHMHIGVVTGNRPNASSMKLFDYGAAKLMTVVPDLHNFRTWFPGPGLYRVPRCEGALFAVAFDAAAENPELIARHGEALHNEVRASFTWDCIFASLAETIRAKVVSVR
jgi:glycosyltransferase involved in cell wall biosynthesis